MSEKQVMNKNEVAIVGGAGFVGSRFSVFDRRLWLSKTEHIKK
jgi:hypothetical protein